MDSRLQHETGVSVAQVAEPNPFESGSPSQLEPSMRDRIKQQWCAIGMSKHKVTQCGNTLSLVRYSRGVRWPLEGEQQRYFFTNLPPSNTFSSTTLKAGTHTQIISLLMTV